MNQTWDVESVFRLFSTGCHWRPRGMPEDYAIFAMFLNRGWISVEVVPYTLTPEPEGRGWPPSEERLAFAYSGGGSGGEAHQRLKWYAWNWLRAQGEVAPEFECWAPHGKADVAAPMIRHIVECGDTNPVNVLHVLGSGHWSTFVLFPFLYVGDEPTCHLFRLTEDGRPRLSEYLVNLSSDGAGRYLRH